MLISFHKNGRDSSSWTHERERTIHNVRLLQMSTKGKRKEHSNYGTKTGCTQSLPGVVLILLLQVYLGGIERLWLKEMCVVWEKSST